jgi:hypothetical protein
MTVYNSPVYVGSVPNEALAGAAFQVYTNTSVPGLTSVNMDFSLTSPADGYTTSNTITQVQLLATNDTITRQNVCTTFTGSLGPYTDILGPTDAISTAVLNPWRYVGDATVKGETRTNGLCNNSTNGAAVAGNTGTSSNFASRAWSYLGRIAQVTNYGSAPNGQPWYYAMKEHAFYGSVEAVNNTSGVWGAFYDPEWNSASTPTGSNFYSDFPLSLAYYLHTVVDGAYTPTAAWDWETANTGTPDDPSATTPAPNQMLITLPDRPILATASSYFAWGHLHADAYYFGITATRRDIAIDNDMMIYDQFYAVADTTSCATEPGLVSLDKYAYYGCPSDTAIVSVLDGNATSPLTVTVVSGATGDSEQVTLTGTAPYFSGTLTLSTGSGSGNNNGILYVSTADTITATYTDTNPTGSSLATASVECPSGDVVYYSNTQISDNGDNDGYADNNETVTTDITIQNNTATDLTNTVVYLFTADPNILCVIDGQASYGTVTAGTTATNPSGDRFQFQVNPSVACTDWQNPPTAKFDVVITGDNFYGSLTPQSYTIPLDLNATASGGSYTYTQNFNSDPSWVTAATPDDTGTCSEAWANNFHWCANCGNAGAGYGAWVGNSAFGTSGQNYSNYDSSTLYSPVFVSNGTPTLAFSVAYRTEATYDGAIVQYKIGSGSWTTLGFTTPAQSATTTSDYCSPLASGVTAWNGTGVTWTTTNAASTASSAGQNIQFRWRLGSDSVGGGTTYGGYGVDSVTITNLKQMVVCEPTRNTSLPNNCTACTHPGAPSIGTITDNDACTYGISIPFTSGSPATRHDLYVDSSLAQSNVSSPVSYTPSNTSSHSYVIRAINDTDDCYTDSTSQSFADTNDSVATAAISSVTDKDACALSGVTITWSAVTGATSYDIAFNTTGNIVGNTTSLTYDYSPGDTSAHNYYVRAKNASCTGSWSTAVAGTDANSSISPISLTASDAAPGSCGILITFTGGAGATQFDLYMDGGPVATNITSGYIYTGVGDNGSHNYVVRGVNSLCPYVDSTPSAASDPDCGYVPPAPLEPDPVTPTTDKNSLSWSASAGATGYRVYRGTKANLAALCDATADFCTAQDSASTSYSLTGDTPADTYKCFYYLVTAYNASGEGSAGTATCGTRTVNTTGICTP